MSVRFVFHGVGMEAKVVEVAPTPTSDGSFIVASVNAPPGYTSCSVVADDTDGGLFYIDEDK